MKIAEHIESTCLKPTTLVADVEQLCHDAKAHGFTAVCVPPLFVKIAARLLHGSGVKVATVISYPLGYSAVEAKLAETLLAMVDGADELDVVVNYMAIKNNDWAYVANEINHILPVVKSKGKIIKLIIETGELTEDEIIKCCDLYGVAGIDYLVTSTGYGNDDADVDTVKLVRIHLPAQVQIMAVGNIDNVKKANELIDAGANRLGTYFGIALVNESGD